jgi:hypothetical protein
VRIAIMTRSGFLFIAVLSSGGLGGAGCSSSESETIIETPLSGKVGGQPWAFQVGTTSAFLSDDTSLAASLYAMSYTPCVDNEPFAMPHVLLSVPRKPGDYDLSLGLSVTFAFGESNNLISTKGKITVDSVTSTTVTGGLVAHFDGGNDVNGQFQATICPDDFAGPAGASAAR